MKFDEAAVLDLGRHDPIGPDHEQEIYCDSQAQVFGDSEKYPIKIDQENELDDFSVEHYHQLRLENNITKSVLIQPDQYGTDHSCLMDSMFWLKNNSESHSNTEIKGVGIVQPDIEDAELEKLKTAGLVGIKFVMGSNETLMDWDEADRLAWRIHDIGWDVQLQMDGSDLHEVEQRIRSWPGRIVFSHIGMFLRTKKTQQRGFTALTRLIDRDKAWVKLSAPYITSEIGEVNDPEINDLARSLVEWAPERMVWGTNWPHLEKLENPPEMNVLLKLARDWVPEASRRKLIMWENPILLYGFSKD